MAQTDTEGAAVFSLFLLSFSLGLSTKVHLPALGIPQGVHHLDPSD